MDQRKIKYGVCLGDTHHIHDRMLNSVQNGLVRWMKKEKQKGHDWTFLVGNHDWDSHGRAHCLEAFKSLVHVVDKPTGELREIDNHWWYLIPWQFNTDTFEQAWRFVEQYKPDVVGLHHDFDDVMYRGQLIGRFGKASELPKNKIILSGHYHDFQQIGPFAWYVSALMQHNWGDSGSQRGAVILSDTLKLERVGLKAPTFRYITDNTLLDLRCPNALRKLVGDQFIRIRRTGPHAARARDRAVAAGARSVEFVITMTDGDLTTLVQEAAPALGTPKFEQIIERYVSRQHTEGLIPKLLTRMGKRAMRSHDPLTA